MNHSQQDVPTLLALDPLLVATAANVFQVPPCPSTDACHDSCQDANRQEISATWKSSFVDNGDMGKESRGVRPGKPITTELQRFIWLVAQLKAAGIGQAEMARRTGIESSHINRLANAERYGYTGLSADIVRKVRDGLNISPDYFLDNYETERPALQLYSLDAQRREKWNHTVEDRLAALEAQLHNLLIRITESDIALRRKDAEIDRLKHELEKAGRRKPKTPR
jgi:transcriptional regulator with XRE-family HTH domain